MKLSVIATLLLSAILSPVNAQTVYQVPMNPAQVKAGCAASTTIGNGVMVLTGTSLCMRLSVGKLASGSGAHTGASIVTSAIGAAEVFAIALSTDPIKKECKTLTSAQISSLNAGKLAVLIKTTTCPSGEIRGQILKV